VVERGAGPLVEVGILPSRARSVVALARGTAEGALRLDLRADMTRTMTALRSIPGIGPWTAELIAMRALGWPDAFPSGHGALLRDLGETSAARAAKHSMQWQPWRSYAVMHLWRQG
jgi:AraC family transcriptional regulator of adaptative response / DNA-3-methyladenine glycosylase II